MKNVRIRQIFREHNGAAHWAAKQLGVTDSSVSQWLSAIKSGASIREDRLQQLRALADRIERTDGKCIDDANGKSVRSQINRIRRGKK